ncbi:MAG: YicC/YloC family endoribonuclease [Lachnospiraceae bacterium]
MIKSMTGFGRYELTEGTHKYTVEMKSVNHRYLDVNIKMPKKFNSFENAIRTELKKFAQRGKVDVYITLEDFSDANVKIHYNKEIASEYMQYFEQMSEEFKVDNDIRVSSLSRFPEVFTMQEATTDEDELWKGLQLALSRASEQLALSRSVEGENLKLDLLDKLEEMSNMVAFIEERSPQIIAEYKEKLAAKVADLLQDVKVDENRLLMEVTIFADKSCVDEEMVRLKSHIQTTIEILQKGGNVGRQLDFIAQEMNREANTTLSKSNDLDISNCAITLKTEIEKIREQIQNIE